jgi:hypothetical protein
MNQQVVIHHWRHSDGWSNVPYVFLKDKSGPGEREFRKESVGWHCWVYCTNHREFLDWMAEHCPGADYTTRFNSGDAMITVNITNKDEAAYFMLNFDV